jgi:hypothetical protein
VKEDALIFCQFGFMTATYIATRLLQFGKKTCCWCMRGQIILSFCHTDHSSSSFFVDQAHLTAEIVGNALQITMMMEY